MTTCSSLCVFYETTSQNFPNKKCRMCHIMKLGFAVKKTIFTYICICIQYTYIKSCVVSNQQMALQSPPLHLIDPTVLGPWRSPDPPGSTNGIWSVAVRGKWRLKPWQDSVVEPPNQFKWFQISQFGGFKPFKQQQQQRQHQYHIINILSQL